MNMRDEPEGMGEAMRKVAGIVLVVMASVVLVASVMAENATNAAKEECVALCKDAAKFMNENGFYPAVAEINNKEGKFVTKNTYVFLMDLEGHLLAHPYNPQYIGRSFLENKDTNGKLYIQDCIAIAKSKGEGWAEYMHPTLEEMKKPTPWEEKKSSKKINFVYRVPGKDLMVVAGYFE